MADIYDIMHTPSQAQLDAADAAADQPAEPIEPQEVLPVVVPDHQFDLMGMMTNYQLPLVPRSLLDMSLYGAAIVPPMTTDQAIKRESQLVTGITPERTPVSPAERKKTGQEVGSEYPTDEDLTGRILTDPDTGKPYFERRSTPRKPPTPITTEMVPTEEELLAKGPIGFHEAFNAGDVIPFVATAVDIFDILAVKDAAERYDIATRNDIMRKTLVRTAPPLSAESLRDHYDYEAAIQSGLGPDAEGHWPSRVPAGPNEGLILKLPGHPTIKLTHDAERALGYNIRTVGDREWSGPPSTPDPWDEDLLVRWALAQRERDIRGYSIPGKTAEILEYMSTVAGEILLTRGLGTAAKTGAQAAVRGVIANAPRLQGIVGLKLAGESLAGREAQVILRAMDRAGRHAVESRMGRIAASGAGVIADTTTLTTLATPFQLGAATVKNMMPGVELTQDEAGHIAALVNDTGDDFLPAFKKAFGSQFIELFSEFYTGGTISTALRVFKRLPVLDKIRGLKMYMIDRLVAREGKAARAISKVSSATGWHGFIGEMGEEVFAGGLGELTGLGEFPTDANDWAAMALAMLTPGALSASFRSMELLVPDPISMRVNDVIKPLDPEAEPISSIDALIASGQLYRVDIDAENILRLLAYVTERATVQGQEAAPEGAAALAGAIDKLLAGLPERPEAQLRSHFVLKSFLSTPEGAAIMDLARGRKPAGPEKLTQKGPGGERIPTATLGALRAQHRSHVENAVKEGREIPADVLADYPDIVGAKESLDRVKRVAIADLAPELGGFNEETMDQPRYDDERLSPDPVAPTKAGMSWAMNPLRVASYIPAKIIRGVFYPALGFFDNIRRRGTRGPQTAEQLLKVNSAQRGLIGQLWPTFRKKVLRAALFHPKAVWNLSVPIWASSERPVPRNHTRVFINRETNEAQLHRPLQVAGYVDVRTDELDKYKRPPAGVTKKVHRVEGSAGIEQHDVVEPEGATPQPTDLGVPTEEFVPLPEGFEGPRPQQPHIQPDRIELPADVLAKVQPLDADTSFWGIAVMHSVLDRRLDIENLHPGEQEVMHGVLAVTQETGEVMEARALRLKLRPGSADHVLFKRKPGGWASVAEMTKEGYDILRMGPGTFGWRLMVQAYAEANMQTFDQVEQVFKQIRNSVVERDGAVNLKHIGGEFARHWDVRPTHLRYRDKMRMWHELQLLESNPVSYTERMIRSTAARMGMVEAFGQDTTGIRAARDYYTDGGGDGPEFDATIRAMYDMAPIKGTGPGLLLGPTNITYRAVQFAAATSRLLESAALTMSAIANIPEILGNTGALMGYGRMVGALGDSLKFGSESRRLLIDSLERWGVVTRDVYHATVDRTRWRSGIINNLAGIVNRVSLVKFLNEHQEQVAAIAALRFVQDLKRGKVRPSDPQFIQLLGFDPASVHRFVTGTARSEEWIDFMQRSARLMTGSIATRADLSVAQNMRWFRVLAPFQSYFFNNIRTMRVLMDQVGRKMVVAYKDRKGNGHWDSRLLAESWESAVLMARYTGGKMAAGAVASMLIAFAYGGDDGTERLRKKWENSGLFAAMWDMAMFSLFGNVWGAAFRTMGAGSIREAQDTLIRFMFPVSQLQELYMVATNQGPYRSLGSGDAWRLWMKRRIPVLRSYPVQVWMTAFAASNDGTLNQAINAYWSWRYDPANKAKPGRYEAATEDLDDAEFRVAMHKGYMEMMHDRDPRPHWFKAMRVQGRDDQSIAKSLYSRRLLTGRDMDDDKRRRLREFLGPQLYDALVSHDEQLTNMAESWRADYGIPDMFPGE